MPAMGIPGGIPIGGMPGRGGYPPPIGGPIGPPIMGRGGPPTEEPMNDTTSQTGQSERERQ